MKSISKKGGLLVVGLLGLFASLLRPIAPIGIERAVEANSPVAGPAVEGTVFAITAGNNLISFSQTAPNAIIKTAAITGLAAGENILGLDFRPRNGLLYAASNQSRVFTINPATGAATQVGTSPLNPVLNGATFGFDFNPVPDRIRVVSDADQNLRLNPDTGAVAGADTNLAFATGDPNASANPNVTGAAYTNNFLGAAATSLYVIDSSLDILALQGSAGGAPVSPNTGQLTTVGALGVNTTDQVGFDIVGPAGLALASLTPMGATTSSLYTINLQTGAAILIGPIGGTEVITDIAAVVRVEMIFALTADNNLLSFSSGSPNLAAAPKPITGLGAGESLVGMDFRPANGLLYALSNQSRVYTINTATAAATPVGGAPFTPPLAGANFGVDFNPVPDRIRVVSDLDMNIRLNPNNGAVGGVDTVLAFATGDPNASANPSVVGSAYTNNFAGTTTTTLYGIDSALNALVLQGSVGGTPVSPNTGQLTTVGVGMLGVDTTDDVGFDIAPVSGAAFASLTVAGAAPALYTINLATGAATMIAPIGSGQAIRDIAVSPLIETIYAVTSSNQLVSFVSTAPGVLLSTVPITGLADETIIGIDYRPANGMLYAIGSSSRIFTINPLTGVATQVGTGITTPQLNGTAYGFDFNPVPDRIRVVSTATHNLRFVPDTAASAGIDTPLAYAQTDARAGQPSTVVGAAYTNNFAGSTSTTLFDIDSNFDTLVRQGSPGGTPVSPNTGQLFTVGPLGVDTSQMVGFDIADCTNNAYASLTVGGISQLYSINLLTGAATLIGNIAGGEVIGDIAIVTAAPAPAAQPTGIVAANAASYATDALAPDSLVALFGRFQTKSGRVYAATSQPLPTTLGDVKVTINGLEAKLLVVSNAQINLMTPQISTDGPGTIIVTNADGSTRTGRVTMARAASGIFTFRATGLGTAAGLWTNDGIRFLPVFNPDGSEREMSPGTKEKPSWLILFTTGLRHVPGANPNDGNGVAEGVQVTIQNANASVTWAGPVQGLSGLDQVNVIIPPELAGAGTVGVKLTVNGKTSNVATVRIGR
ncbi:MAG: DUF4394 domain-containing protein [Blastocatellia bacterium]